MSIVRGAFQDDRRIMSSVLKGRKEIKELRDVLHDFENLRDLMA